MNTNVTGTVLGGTLKLDQPLSLPDQSRVRVTIQPVDVGDNGETNDGEANFWSGASESSLAAVWDNTEDDVYAQLLDE